MRRQIKFCGRRGERDRSGSVKWTPDARDHQNPFLSWKYDRFEPPDIMLRIMLSAVVVGWGDVGNALVLSIKSTVVWTAAVVEGYPLADAGRE